MKTKFACVEINIDFGLEQLRKIYIKEGIVEYIRDARWGNRNQYFSSIFRIYANLDELYPVYEKRNHLGMPDAELKFEDWIEFNRVEDIKEEDVETIILTNKIY